MNPPTDRERPALSEALFDIAAERQRQIEVEGWTPEHDDGHDDGHMLRAAVFYLWHGTEKAAPMDANGVPLAWPWEPQWWKPKDRRSNLIRAGALCLAEMDRAKRGYERDRARRQRLRRAGPIWDVAPVGHIQQKLDIIAAEIERLDRKTHG